MCPRIWPIEDICIGLYVLKRHLTVQHILEKVMSMQHSFDEFSEKQRRVELKSVGNFVAKTVLVESANQFSLEELCRTQYSLIYFFRSHIDHHTYSKTLRIESWWCEKWDSRTNFYKFCVLHKHKMIFCYRFRLVCCRFWLISLKE